MKKPTVKKNLTVQDRLPPHNVDTERLILGAIMFDNGAIDKIVDEIQPPDFYKLAHREIFKAMLDLHGREEGIDAVLLSQYLESSGELENCGGTDYLIDLLGDTTTAANIVYHSKLVSHMSKLRALISLSSDIARRAYEVPKDIVEFLEETHSDISKITLSTDKSRPEKLANIMEKSISNLEDLSKKGITRGLSTGYDWLDEKTGGFGPGDLIILGARPGIGKTAFATNIAVNMAKAGRRGLFFSLEMSKEQLSNRITCSEAFLNSAKINKPKWINENEWERVTEGYKRVCGIPLYIDDTGSISINQVYSKSNRQKAETGLDFIVIDYLQLMNGRRGERYSNSTARVTAISKFLKGLAMDLNIPVLALSQLSRESVKANRQPVLMDLRESGSIEQDADKIMFLHREFDNLEPDEVNTQLIVAKNRSGATGSTHLLFDKPHLLYMPTYKKLIEETE